MVESGVVEGCGDLGAEAGFAFRNDGVPEAFDVDAVVQEGVAHISGIAALTEFDYDNPFTKGNVTSERRWDSQISAYVSFNRVYDSRGNLTDIYEPAVRTHIEYDGTSTYPQRVYYAYGSPAQRTWRYSWNASAGVITSKIDVDNANFTASYGYDAVGRLRSVNEGGLRYSETAYDDANNRVTVKRDLAAFRDGKLQTVTQYDQLGRVTRVRNSEAGPLSPSGNDGIKVKTIYRMQPGGQCIITTTPYRDAAFMDPTLEWSRTQYDQLGRVTSVARFRGSVEPDCQSSSNRTGITYTAYDAAYSSEGLLSARRRTIDPAGKMRDEYHDALGRLRQVSEDPFGQSYVTVYRYDPLGNLTDVTQGAQTRTFEYSSLGLLVSSSNPESNTDPDTLARVPTIYTYYPSGDLRTRRDARGITTTFGYDELRRVRTKTYDDGTPGVTYNYYPAGASPKVGQLQSAVTTSGADVIASTVYNNYDVLGRVLSSSHTIAGIQNPFTFGYEWWHNGGLQRLIYPTGRTVDYDMDDAGRIRKVYTSSRTYADLSDPVLNPAPYTPDGRIARMRLGNGLWETNDYQAPGIPSTLRLGTSAGANDRMEIEYRFSPDQYNGNLLRQTTRRRVGGSAYEWVQSFEAPDSYDSLNRLRRVSETTTAGSTSWSQTYGYDQFGNRWAYPPTGEGLTSSDVHEPTATSNFHASTNRLYIADSRYDTAGNQKYYAPYTLDYDSENRNLRMTSTSSGSATFVYDGDGRRVKKIWAPYNALPITTYYIHNALGQLAMEYSTEPATPGTVYPFTDMLGSTRAVTDASGTTVECYDYLPFGRYLGAQDNSRAIAQCFPNLSQPVTGRSPQKFTGKERDSETNLDFFGARYMSAAQGRFTSVDPSMESVVLQSPQTWNRYSYTLNNPLRYIDPTGESWVESGNVHNPYSWVDSCEGLDEKCYEAIAAVVRKRLVIYGSSGANDIVTYAGNRNGYFDLRRLTNHPDANFEIKFSANSFLMLNNAAAFFNTAEQYHEAYPSDAKLFVTDAGIATGGVFGKHKTHDLGRSIDVRYLDSNGRPLQGDTAAKNADMSRIGRLVDVAEGQGFGQNYSARPKDFGTLYANDHENHLHIGTTKPVIQKITPPKQ